MSSWGRSCFRPLLTAAMPIVPSCLLAQSPAPSHHPLADHLCSTHPHTQRVKATARPAAQDWAGLRL
eukprot:234644-Chlamydomonas_euryale.AAC.3